MTVTPMITAMLGDYTNLAAGAFYGAMGDENIMDLFLAGDLRQNRASVIESLVRIPSGRRHAVIADPVSNDTAARRLIVTIMLVAIALDQSCASAMAPAPAAAAGAFALERDATAWLDISFSIGYLAPIGVSVWAIARFGKRAYLGWSLTAFGGFTLLCAVAPTVNLLILARVLEGAAAGGFFTCGLLTMVATAPRSDLPLAMTLFAAVMLLARNAHVGRSVSRSARTRHRSCRTRHRRSRRSLRPRCSRRDCRQIEGAARLLESSRREPASPAIVRRAPQAASDERPTSRVRGAPARRRPLRRSSIFPP